MGSQLSTEERIKEQTKLLNRQNRALTRELTKLEREKHSICLKIKACAKKGNMELLDALATQYSVYKNNIKKLYRVQGNLQNVTQRVQLLKSTQEINQAILQLTSTLKQTNAEMGLPVLSRMLYEFENETQKTEMVSERLDELFEDDVDEDEKNEIVDSVLAEVGVELGVDLKLPPSNDLETTKLENRFNGLKI